MANDAIVNAEITVLPDLISKTIVGSMTITPADANDKWYYKLTSVSNASSDLMAGYFTDYSGVDDDTSPTAIDSADLVKFLLIKNTDTSNDVYINLDGGVITDSSGDAVKIPAGASWYANLPNTTVGNIHAISSASTVNCLVAALLDDIA